LVSLENIIAISCARFHALALESDGSVWAFGDNEYGQVGDVTGAATYSGGNLPIRVRGLPLPARDVIAGTFYSIAVLQDDSVWCWGYAPWWGIERSEQPIEIPELWNAIILSAATDLVVRLESGLCTLYPSPWIDEAEAIWLIDGLSSVGH
jgi:alpha-tubulin suppressor-like RCC1 family protein